MFGYGIIGECTEQELSTLTTAFIDGKLELGEHPLCLVEMCSKYHQTCLRSVYYISMLCNHLLFSSYLGLWPFGIFGHGTFYPELEQMYPCSI